MVAKEFIDFYNGLYSANRIAVEDFSDRLSFFTAIFFLIMCLLISAKQYFLGAISCYIPVNPTGENFKDFLVNYCWVHGTIPLRPGEHLPQTPEEWKDYDDTRRITYYQWIPFVLGLQCILFYLPHVAWQSISCKRSGGDLFALIKSASEAATQDRASRKTLVRRVAEFVEDMLGGHQDCRKGHRVELARKAYSMFGPLVISKRLGTRLVASYFLLKIYIIFNAAIQIYVIQRFLGFVADGSVSQKSMDLQAYNNPTMVPSDRNPTEENLSGFGFGLTVFNHITSGRDWPQTLLFPRVAFCYIPEIRLVGVKNSYTAQCALPINMLNEKIYIFFWFWLVFLITATITSLLLWITRIAVSPKRKDFIKRYLRLHHIKSDSGDELMRNDLNDFVDEYLRRDGVFLVRMLSINAGELITSEIVTCLYEYYLETHVKPQNSDSSLAKSVV